MSQIQYRDFLQSAARAVEDQVADNPLLGIPVDPDVAEYMGAFEEDPAVLQVIDLEVESEGEANG